MLFIVITLLCSTAYAGFTLTYIGEDGIVIENNTESDINLDILRANYNNIKLDNVKIIKSILSNSKSVTKIPLNGTANDKVFLWNSLSSMTPYNVVESKQTLLVFEIDECIADKGLLNKYKTDYTKLNLALDNIAEALEPLLDKYRVAVLIYPTSHYTRGAVNPIDRLDPVLMHTINYLGDRRIGTVIELISSGIAKWNTDGTLDTMTMAPMYDTPDNLGRKALSMDLDALKALKSECGNSLVGVRLHEIYGGVRRSISIPIDVKARPYDEELIKEVANVCDANNLELIWGDSSWLIGVAKSATDSFSEFVYSPDKRKAFFETEPFYSTQAFASELLGKNSYFMWNNNNYNVTYNLGFYSAKVKASVGQKAKPVSSWNYFDQPFTDFPLKEFGKSKWGMSVQSWFWPSIQDVLLGTNFRNSEAAMPYEVMQAYVAKALRENADVIQFEPPWYLFNYPSESWELRNAGTSTSLYEQLPDYSKRFALEKMIETLLDYKNTPLLENIFDQNQQRFIENDYDNQPNNFKKIVLASEDFTKVKYNYNANFENDTVIRAYILQNAKCATRIDVNGDGQDEIAVLKNDTVYIYSNTNCLLKTFVVTNAKGLTSANLLQNTIDGGDSDELIIIYGENANKIASIYEVFGYSNGMMDPEFRKLSSVETTSILTEFHVPDKFFWIQGKRNSDVRYINNTTRPLDELITIVDVDNTDQSASGVPIMATVDYNLDGVDELAKSTDGKIKIYSDGNILTSTDFVANSFLMSLKSSVPKNKIGVDSTNMWYRGSSSNGYVLKAQMNELFGKNNSPSSAIDNNEQTYAQATSNVLWDLILDLGFLQGSQKLYLSKGSANYTSSFRIDVSDDGQNWRTLITENSAVGGSKVYNFVSTSFRYAKFIALEAVGTNAHAIREIKFYNN